METNLQVEPYQDNVWKLVSLGEPKIAESVEEAIEISEKTAPQLLTDDEEVYEIDELTFKL